MNRQSKLYYYVTIVIFAFTVISGCSFYDIPFEKQTQSVIELTKPQTKELKDFSEVYLETDLTESGPSKLMNASFLAQTVSGLLQSTIYTSVVAGIFLVILLLIWLYTRFIKNKYLALTVSEKQFRTIARISPVGLFHANIDGQCNYVNEKWCEITGLSFESSLGYGWKKTIHPEDLDDVFFSWYESIKKDTLFNLEYRFLTPDHVEKKVMGLVMPEKDDMGKIVGYVVTITDITELKNLETALIKNERSLILAQSIAQVGNWDWDIPNNSILWSDEIYRILGFKPQQFKATYQDFMERVHPDDRYSVEEEIRLAFEEKKEYTLKHRIVLPDGQEKIVYGKGRAYFDLHNKPIKMIGTLQDITKDIEIKYQLKLAHQIFENAIEGVMVINPENRIISVNPAFTTITQYTEEEVIGKNPDFLRSNKHDNEFYDAMWRSIKDYGLWEGEVWNRRKNGEAFPQWLTIRSVNNSFGVVTQHIALFYDMSLIKEGEEKLKYQSNHDVLTGLANKALFIDRLNFSILQKRRMKEGKIGVLFLGLDRFKKINETLGHHIGDELLQLVAKRLTQLIEDGNTIARWGSDEFSFILDNIKGVHDTVQFAQELMSLLTKPFMLENNEVYITTSIGIAIFPNDSDEAYRLLIKADSAMHQAKKQGRNKYLLFAPSMNTESLNRLTLEGNLRKAFENNEFVLYFQPKLNTKTKKIVGSEVLVRWKNPKEGLVSPGTFIPLLEEIGLIVPLGYWILKEACKQNKKWQDTGYAPIPVSVNISAIQFAQGNFLTQVAVVLKESQLEPKYLELEITEGTLIDNVEDTIIIMKKLKDMGVSLSIDDFGTGYSSLSYLKRFPIDTLKIDQSFVKDLTTDSDDAAIVKAIISLAFSLKLKVIAEGVETEEQYQFLLRENCHEIQGYYFSKPLSIEAFNKHLNGK